MIKNLFTLSFILFLGISNAQTVELVTDYNTGPNDAFNEWYYTSINFKGEIFFPLFNEEHGLELASLKDGSLNLVKDINEGSESSTVRDFFEYEDKLYFVAEDEINGAAIWSTDGSDAGTVLEFDPGDSPWADPRFFTLAKNGWMYFSYGDKIFRMNGEVFEEVYEGVFLTSIDYAAANTFCTYKNGIAFIQENNDYSYTIWHMDDNEAIELATTVPTNFSADAFGISQVETGLIFSIDRSDDNDGLYLYDENNATISLLEVDGSTQETHRIIDLNENQSLCWIRDKGFYIVNGIAGEEEFLFFQEDLANSAREQLAHAIFEDKFIFVPRAFFISDPYIVYSDGTEAGTQTLRQLDNDHYSNILTHNQYAYFSYGVSNLFEPTILQINLATGELVEIKAFEEDAKQIESILFIGVQNEYLYFINKLDDTVGAELYRLKLDMLSDVSDFEDSQDLVLNQNLNQFSIDSDSPDVYSLNLIDVNGRNVSNKQVYAQEIFTFNITPGTYFLQISTSTNRTVKQVIIH